MRRIPFSNLALLFIMFVVGWFGGGLFMLAMFSMTDEEKHSQPSIREKFTNSIQLPHLRSSSNFPSNRGKSNAGGVRDATIKVMKSLDNALSIKIKESSNHDLPIQILPTFTSDRSFEDGRGYSVLLDWPLDDHMFSYIQYKALESLLYIFPESNVRCILATSLDAYSLKIDYSLSTNHFQKYQKMGYNIELSPVGRMDKGYLSQIGKEYWQRHMKSCCDEVDGRIQGEQPYHLLTYIRLHKLWRKGGLFTDFSFFFLGPIDKSVVRQGYYINSNCDYDTQGSYKLPSSSSDKNSTSYDGIRSSTRCITSTLLIFNEPKNDAILCALKSYEDPIFITCIESDDVLGGAHCIQDVLEACFAAANLINDLDVNIDSKASVLEVFKGDPFYAQRIILSSTWHLRRNVRIIWLGAIAYIGTNKQHDNPPLDSSSSYHNSRYLNDTMIGAGILKVQLSSHISSSLTSYMNSEATISPTISSSVSSSLSDPLTRTIINLSDAKTMKCRRYHDTGGCMPSLFLPGFDAKAVVSLYSTLTSHRQVLQPLISSSTGASQCYSLNNLRHHTSPTYNASSSATSSLPSSPSSYHEHRSSSPSHCYPYIEPGESFISIDASSSYYLDYNIANIIYSYNPDAKFIFIINHPIEQLYHSYHDLISTMNADQKASYPSLDNIALQAMRKDQPYGMLRSTMRNISNPQPIIDLYYHHIHNITYDIDIGVDDAMIDRLFQAVIYYPAIIYYQQLFGADHVLVKLSSELDPYLNISSYDHHMQHIYRFLDLPADIQHMKPPSTHHDAMISSNITDAPTTIISTLSQDIIHKLTIFFHPINLAFQQATNLNISHWDDPYYMQHHGYHLPLYSQHHNTSLPPLWFEIEDNIVHPSERHGIISHLLPKGKASADAGFNTTFGMLVAF